MDTKTLYDAGIGAGINFLNESHEHDCIDVWVKACLLDKEWIDDNLGDLLVELTHDNIRYKLVESVERADRYNGYLSVVPGRSWTTRSPELINGFVISLNSELARLGGTVMTVLVEHITIHVKQNLSDWFADCASYQRDMDMALKEDHDTARYKEDRDEPF